MWDATKQAWVAVSPSDKLDKPLVGTPLSAVWIQDGIHLYYQVSADGQATEYLVVPGDMSQSSIGEQFSVTQAPV